MYFFAELRNFFTTLFHLFVDGLSQLSVVMFTTDQHFLQNLMTKKVHLPLNREALLLPVLGLASHRLLLKSLAILMKAEIQTQGGSSF